MISDEIIKILSYIGEQFGIIVDWNSQNVVPYLQQLGEKIVKLDIVQSYSFLVLAVIVFIVGIVVLCIGIRKAKTAECDFGKETFAMIFIIVGFVLIWCNINNLLIAYNLPEMTIYNYCKSLIQSIK